MRSSKRLYFVLAAALAAGAALPVVVPAPALAADKVKDADEIKAENVPAPAMVTFQKVITPGTKVRYVKQDRSGGAIYVAEYEAANGKKAKFHVKADGTVFGDAGDNPNVDLSKLAAPAVPAVPPITPAAVPAPAPAAPLAADLPTRRAQIAADIDQREASVEVVNAKVAALNAQIAQQDAAAARGDAAAKAQADRLRAELAQQSVERDRQTVEIARQEQRIRDIDAQLYPAETAAAAKIAQEGEGAAGASDGKWHYTKIENTDVPAAAYGQMLKVAKGAHGTFYRKDEQGSTVAYSVFYITPQNKRYWASFFPDGKVRQEPRLSIYQPEPATAGAGTTGAGGATPAAARVPAADGHAEESAADQKGMKYKAIPQAEVPAAALKGMDKYTKGNKDLAFREETHPDGKVTYSAHYVTPENKRYWISVDPKGALEKGPLLSTSQPEPAKETKTPAKTGK